MYYIQKFGDEYQSVFPEELAHLSALHTSIDDAFTYIVECVPYAKQYIEVIQ